MTDEREKLFEAWKEANKARLALKFVEVEYDIFDEFCYEEWHKEGE